jgi:hypothetical protein
VASDQEQETLSLMRGLRRSGKSFRAIAVALDSGGHRPRRGSTWHPYTVKRILSRKTSRPRSVSQDSGTAA